MPVGSTDTIVVITKRIITAAMCIMTEYKTVNGSTSINIGIFYVKVTKNIEVRMLECFFTIILALRKPRYILEISLRSWTRLHFNQKNSTM